MLDCVLINEVVNGAFMLMKCFEVTEEKLPLHRITYMMYLSRRCCEKYA